jgi:hypothetical protein
VLFNTAVDIINTLAAAQSGGRLKREIGRYLKPNLLVIDELGYLPIDKLGADLLFQIINQRYERAPMVITTNRAYKHWSQIFTEALGAPERIKHAAVLAAVKASAFRRASERQTLCASRPLRRLRATAAAIRNRGWGRACGAVEQTKWVVEGAFAPSGAQLGYHGGGLRKRSSWQGSVKDVGAIAW